MTLQKPVLISLALLQSPLLSAQDSKPSPVTAPQDRPNVVVIVADDVAPAYLGCYGGPTPTPHLDSLARDGWRFARAHAVSPLCNPSRYTLLTGQIPGRNPELIRAFPAGEAYSVQQNTRITPETDTIFRKLERAGYFTGYVGKWHSNFVDDPELELPADANLDDPAVNARLKEHQAAYREYMRKNLRCDVVKNVIVGNLDSGVRPKPLKHHQTEWITDGALEFLDEAAQSGQPFFLHLANTVPHEPDVFPSIDADPKYTYGGLWDTTRNRHPARATLVDRLRSAGLPVTGYIGSVNAGTMQLDDQMGIVLEKLESLGLADNTMVVFVADHAIFGKGTAYAVGTHVPLLVRFPKNWQAGRTVHNPVSLLDIAATIEQLAGVPSDQAASDGTSFVSAESGKRPVYSEAGYTRSVIFGDFQYIALRYPESVLTPMERGEASWLPGHEGNERDIFGRLNIPYKPAYFDPDQLYDLKADPLCRVNLAERPEHRATLDALKTMLAAELNKIGQPFDPEAPPFMGTDRYRQLAAARHVESSAHNHYPKGANAEEVIVFNRRDPEARY